jgi:hypothetical protein
LVAGGFCANDQFDPALKKVNEQEDESNRGTENWSPICAKTGWNLRKYSRNIEQEPDDREEINAQT